MELPVAFAGRVVRDLGPEEGAALCAALDGVPPVSVRLHPAKCGDAGALLRRLGACGQVPWCADGHYLTERPQFTFDPAFHAGAYYVQEAASQFVGRLVGDVAGRRVLDLCAAPGGKTTLYASLVGPEGLVVANEIDRRRASVLADNVRKWGTGNVAVTACEPKALGEFENWFDAVAVDAPCSGEGMFRKDPASRGEWSEGNVRLCAARQDAILREAWRALKPGGRLIYSTCTFNRDEDEGTLERMLAWAGDEVAEAAEADSFRIAAMALPLAGILFVGFFPATAVGIVDRAAGFFLAAPPAVSDFLLSPVLSAVGRTAWLLVGVIGLLAWLRARTLRGRTVAQGPTWGCGFTSPNVRMQYTGESFSEGLQSIVPSLTQQKGEGDAVAKSEIFPSAHRYDIRRKDRIDRLFAAWWVEALRLLNQRAMRLRTGKINSYILFALAFLGLVFLLSVLHLL